MAKKQAAKRRKVSKESEEVTVEVEDSSQATHKAEASEASEASEATATQTEPEPEFEKPTQSTHGGEAKVSDGKYRNKQRCLTVSSRGVPARFRHLMEDLRTLMPHHKKESKLDPGSDGIGQAVNDISEIRGCNSVLFLECRKRQDCYMWLGRTGADAKGPSARFHVTNVHTMDELRLTGNCMKASRPILSFDDSFEKVGHLQLLKELFIDTFGTPRGHPKAKPFVDRVMAFYYADKRVSERSRRSSAHRSFRIIKMSVYLRNFR
jgi:ribosome biogenesis protein BRX1